MTTPIVYTVEAVIPAREVIRIKKPDGRRFNRPFPKLRIILKPVDPARRMKLTHDVELLSKADEDAARALFKVGAKVTFNGFSPA